MTISQDSTMQALADLLAAKVEQAMVNGATEAQAIAAIRQLWLEAVAK